MRWTSNERPIWLCFSPNICDPCFTLTCTTAALNRGSYSMSYMILSIVRIFSQINHEDIIKNLFESLQQLVKQVVKEKRAKKCKI